MNSRRIAIIGSGLGGLVAAATLAARGHQVDVFERSPWLGGKAAVLQQDGYRFDMGPTILTVPSVLRRVFGEAGEILEDHLDLVRLDPQWRSFFEDGSVLDLREDEQAMVTELERFAPGSSDGYRRFQQLAKRLSTISERYYFWRSVGGLGDLASDVAPAAWGRLLLDVMAIRPGRSAGGTIRSHVPDARVGQMLDHFTQYVGSCPDASPAILCGIAHMQTAEGVWYPRGGIRAVPEALIALGESLGVRFHTNATVTSVELQDGAVSAVRVDGVLHPVDAAVSNMDAVRTADELLGGRYAKALHRRYPKVEPACSGVVLYLGLARRYDQLAHHNFVFSEDPHAEFEAIYKDGRPAEDPTVYVCAPAISDRSVAPEGGEALYALVHTPYLREHHDWATLFPGYRDVILDKLERVAGLDGLRERIVTEAHLTPEDIHRRYNVLNGAIYGIASHGTWTGAFKPANRSPDVPGLYLAGGAAHPGPGMPMVMMSGWIAADSLDADQRQLARTPAA